MLVTGSSRATPSLTYTPGCQARTEALKTRAVRLSFRSSGFPNNHILLIPTRRRLH